MTVRTLALTSAFSISLAGLAAAQDGERYEFSTLDVDGDGMVTLAELEAVIDPGVAEDASPQAILEAQDEDGDGMISLEEAGSDQAVYTMEDEDDDDV